MRGVGLQCVNVVFHDHTHLPFLIQVEKTLLNAGVKSNHTYFLRMYTLRLCLTPAFCRLPKMYLNIVNIYHFSNTLFLFYSISLVLAIFQPIFLSLSLLKQAVQ